MTHKTEIQKKVKSILQNAIADRVGYEDRFCEENLCIGLKEAEEKLTSLVQQSKEEERERVREQKIICHEGNWQRGCVKCVEAQNHNKVIDQILSSLSNTS